MNQESIEQLRVKAGSLYQQAWLGVERVPVKARVLLGLFLVAAPLMAIHTALTSKDANLHLKLQHGFRDAQLSVWVDGDLAFSGKVTGSAKKRFGLIPTDSVRGSLSQIIPVRSGQHNIGVRIEPDDATTQVRRLSVDSVFDVTVGGRFTGSRGKPCNNGFSRKGGTQRAPGEFYVLPRPRLDDFRRVLVG